MTNGHELEYAVGDGPATSTDSASIGRRRQTFRFLGVRIRAVDLCSFVDEMLRLPADESRVSVHFTNAHLLVEAANDPALAAVLNRPDSCVMPDGMPLAWAGRLKGVSARRVTGPTPCWPC